MWTKNVHFFIVLRKPVHPTDGPCHNNAEQWNSLHRTSGILSARNCDGNKRPICGWHSKSELPPAPSTRFSTRSTSTPVSSSASRESSTQTSSASTPPCCSRLPNKGNMPVLGNVWGVLCACECVTLHFNSMPHGLL